MDGHDAFSKLIEALRPALDTVIIAGGWAHRLHRLTPGARQVKYDPLATEDVDVVVERDHGGHAPNIARALLDAGFAEEFFGEAQPPVTHYQLGTEGRGFFAEFLTPLRGGLHRRAARPDETATVRGVKAQKLRRLELLLIEPWPVEISARMGFDLGQPASVFVPNPITFIVQKLLVHFDRKPAKRAGDLLYVHDTVDLFSEQLDELAEIWRDQVAPRLSRRASRELRSTQDALLGSVVDTMRQAARLVPHRRMDPERMRLLCHAGLSRLLP